MWIVQAARIGPAARVGSVGAVTAERVRGRVRWWRVAASADTSGPLPIPGSVSTAPMS